MPWILIEDDFYDHMKFAEAGPLGLAQWIAGLAYCNRNLTDGVIPISRARTLIDWDGIMWHVGHGLGAGEMVDGEMMSEWLVKCGLWDNGDGCYVVHDYLEHQRSRNEIEELRQSRHLQRVKGGKSRVKSAIRDANGRLVSAGQNQQGQLDASASTSSEPRPTPTPTIDNLLCAFDADFDAAWKMYPRKEYRKSAFDAYTARRRQGITADELLTATVNFSQLMALQGRAKEHTMLGSTFYGPKERWKDHLEVTKQRPFGSGSTRYRNEES